MSFRFEEKLNIDKHKLSIFLDWVSLNGGEELYPPRVVSSIYFDNLSFDMYLQSEEGLVPRKKIRLRAYTSDDHTAWDSTFETKITSIEGRFKTALRCRNVAKILRLGMLDPEYGVLLPVARVEYLRSYYIVHGVRVTVDKNITYRRFGTKESRHACVHDSAIIVEIKAPISSSIDFLFDSFPFERVRFSKYCRAVAALYNI